MARVRARWYVGFRNGKATAFRSLSEPTPSSHGKRFSAVMGPFRTRRGAEFRATNRLTPLRTVAEIEAAARDAN